MGAGIMLSLYARPEPAARADPHDSADARKVEMDTGDA